MRDDNFYCVYGWMVNRLHLKGSGLALFAVVYGLIRRDERRGGSGEIELSLAYASEGTGLTERQTRRELNKLTESWILERTTRDGKRSVFKLSYSTKIAIAKREDILSRQTPDILSPLSPKNGDKERGEDILSENPGHFVPPTPDILSENPGHFVPPHSSDSKKDSRDYSNGGKDTETEVPRGEPRADSLAELTRQYSRKLSELLSVQDEAERSKEKIVLEFWYQKEKKRLGG